MPLLLTQNTDEMIFFINEQIQSTLENKKMIHCQINCFSRHFLLPISMAFFAGSKINNIKKTYYQVLQIPSTASQTNIKNNYLKLAKIFHPDVYKGSDQQRFDQIKKAYDTLSDVKKRQQYDQQIGIRKKNFEPQNKTAQQTQKEDISDSLKNNNINYEGAEKQESNFDEEYQKFFKKKKQTNFEEIRLHEQQQFKQMNEQERMRFRVRQLYDKQDAHLKINRTKSFEDLLDDQIDQRNVHHEDIKKRNQKLSKINSEIGIRIQKILIYFLAVIGALAFYPLLISFWTKYRQQKQQKQKIFELLQRIKTKAQQEEIRSRFQY